MSCCVKGLVALVEVDKFKLLVFACGTECYCETWCAEGGGEPGICPF
jgi:hypothetical protein